MRLPLRLALVLTLAACDPPSALDGDGGVSFAPLAVAPPASPVFACPPGWRERVLYDATICEPWAEDSAPTCAPNELAVLGQPADQACQPVAPCPSGEWPDDVPLDAVYVQLGALDGDGSRDRPFGTLAAGAGAAQSAHAALVLGEGEYLAGVRLSGIPAVIGVCPERTRISDADPMHIGFDVLDHVELRGLSVSAGYLGVQVAAGASVVMNGVIVEGGANAVRLRAGATLDGDRVLLRGPSVLMPSVHQPALQLSDQSRVTLRHAVLTGVGGAIIAPTSVDVPPPTFFATVTLEDSVLLDTAYGLVGPLDLTLTRVAIERVAIAAQVSASRTASFTDVRVRDIGDVPYEGGSVGLLVTNGACTLHRVALSRVHGYALAALDRTGVPSSIVGEDVFISETDESLGPSFDDHIAVLTSGSGATATYDRIVVASIVGSAFHTELGAHLTVHDARVTDAHAWPPWGRGFEIVAASAVLERASVETEDLALFVVLEGTADVTDLAVRGGLGIQVQCTDAPCTVEGTRLTLERASLRDVLRAGIFANHATAELTDIDIAGVSARTTPIVPDNIPATGIGSLLGAAVRGTRVRIERVEGTGVFAWSSSSTDLTGLAIRDLRSVPCPACGGPAFGDGVFWSNGSTLSLSDFLIEDGERAGLAAGEAFGPPTFVRGITRHNPLGLLTPSSVDIGAFDGLTYVDNDQDFGTLDFSIDLDPASIEFGYSESELQ